MDKRQFIIPKYYRIEIFSHLIRIQKKFLSKRTQAESLCRESILEYMDSPVIGKLAVFHKIITILHPSLPLTQDSYDHTVSFSMEGVLFISLSRSMDSRPQPLPIVIPA